MPNLQYSREFVTLVQTKNYLQAAEILYMSQSTLSRHIQALEKELGQPLFVRNTRNVELTDFGALYEEYARQIVDVEDRFQDRLRQDRPVGSKNNVSVALVYLGACFGIPEALDAVKEKHPEIQVDTYFESASISEALCLKGSYDLIVLRRQKADTQESQFVHVPYCLDEIVLAMSAHHRLTKYEKVPFLELVNEKFVAQSLEAGAFQRFSEECVNFGFRPNVGAYDENIFYLLDYVSLNQNITVLSKANFDALQGIESVVSRGLDPDVMTPIEILYPKDRPLSESASLVLRGLLEESEKRFGPVPDLSDFA